MVLRLLVDLSLKECSCTLKALGYVIVDEKFQAVALAFSIALNNICMRSILNNLLLHRDSTLKNELYFRARPIVGP